MKLKATATAISLALGLGASMAASAGPIQLFTGEVSKLKFTNYENVTQGTNAGNDPTLIDQGDIITGVLIITSINNLDSSQNKNAQLGANEVTGIFQFHVTGTGTLPALAAGTGHLDFDLLAGDFITTYVGTGATMDFTAGSCAAFGGNCALALAASLASASNGTLWTETLGSGNHTNALAGDYYVGFNDSNATAGTSTNTNWMNLTTNATGYNITTQDWPSTAGIVLPGTPTYLGAAFTSALTQVFFQSKLNFNINPDRPWAFQSEDPLFVYAEQIPEPGTLALLGLGLFGLPLVRRRKG